MLRCWSGCGRGSGMFERFGNRIHRLSKAGSSPPHSVDRPSIRGVADKELQRGHSPNIPFEGKIGLAADGRWRLFGLRPELNLRLAGAWRLRKRELGNANIARAPVVQLAGPVA